MLTNQRASLHGLVSLLYFDDKLLTYRTLTRSLTYSLSHRLNHHQKKKIN
jgi:hypothetical protein